MSSSKRVIVNTLAQNIRSLLNIGMSLYSARIVLDALGESDYGIFSLVGGVISMLGFITNAMVVSTQRHLSFLYGKGDNDGVHKMFSSGLLLHYLWGILLVLLFVLVRPLVFNSGILNIEASRHVVANSVYLILVISLFVSFITAPFRALFIARENIVFISIVDVIDGALKLGLVFTLYQIPSDRLVVYALIVTGIAVFNLVALAGYGIFKYSECCLIPRRFDSKMMRQMSSFAGWTIYSTGCIVGRTQGLAVVLNHFFGEVINSAYGIAIQVTGAVQFVAQSVQNAMSPQIVKSEGNANRNLMLSKSESASKFAFLLMAIVVIPLVWEMPHVLDCWLKNVPDYSVVFCQYVLIAALIDQITIGLGIANQAIGKIRNYSLVINTIKLLTLPIAWICLVHGFPVESTMYCYLGVEILCACLRLPFLKYTAGLSIRHFVGHVCMRVVLPVLMLIMTCFIFTRFIDIEYRFIYTLIVSAILCLPVIWYGSLCRKERYTIREIIKRK